MARGQKKEKKKLTPEEHLQNALVPKEEWPYELPEGWQFVRVEGLTTRVKRGKAPKYVEHSDVPVFAQKCNQKDGTIAMEKAKFLNPALLDKWSDEELLQDEDVIINSTGTGTLGRVGFYRTAYALPYRKVLPDSHITVVRHNEFVNPRYLYYFLKGRQPIFELQGAGTTNQKELRPETISSVPCPLPVDKKIQDSIVLFIDHEFARLDEAKEGVQSVIDSSEKRKQIILHKAFTGELTDKWRKENGVSLDSWHKEKLKSICDINPKKEDVSGYDDDMEVSFFPMASLDEQVGAITNPQIRPLKDVKKGFTNFREGDVVFAKITPCMENGKSAVIGKLVNDIGYGTTEFYVFRCGGKIDRYYLFHLLRSQKFRDDAKQEMTGAVGQQRVPKKYLENYEVNLPSTDEQKEIVRLLNSFIEKEDEIEDASEQIMSNVENNKKSILSKAFRGELHL